MPTALVTQLRNAETRDSTLAKLKSWNPDTQKKELLENEYEVVEYAAEHDPELFKELITIARKLDKTFENNFTAIMLKSGKAKIFRRVVESGHVESAELLLKTASLIEKTPKIDIKYKDLVTHLLTINDQEPFKISAQKGHFKMFKFIRKALQDKEIPSKDIAWLEALADAAKTENVDLFYYIKEVVERKFKGQLSDVTKTRDQESNLKYKFFDTLTTLLESKNEEEIATGEEMATDLFDTIFLLEDDKHSMLHELLTMGETSAKKSERKYNKGKFVSPRRAAASDSAAEIKQRYEIFITALDNNLNEFFIHTFNVLSNEIDHESAQNVLNYTYSDAGYPSDDRRARKSVIGELTKRKENKDSHDNIKAIFQEIEDSRGERRSPSLSQDEAVDEIAQDEMRPTRRRLPQGAGGTHLGTKAELFMLPKATRQIEPATSSTTSSSAKTGKPITTVFRRSDKPSSAPSEAAAAAKVSPNSSRRQSQNEMYGLDDEQVDKQVEAQVEALEKQAFSRRESLRRLSDLHTRVEKQVEAQVEVLQQKAQEAEMVKSAKQEAAIKEAKEAARKAALAAGKSAISRSGSLSAFGEKRHADLTRGTSMPAKMGSEVKDPSQTPRTSPRREKRKSDEQASPDHVKKAETEGKLSGGSADRGGNEQ